MQASLGNQARYVGGSSPLAKKGADTPYQQWDTSLTGVEKLLACSHFEPGIAEYARNTPLCSQFPVLDWGCGSGRAVIELGAAVPANIELHGFSGERDKRWQSSSRVKFTEGGSEELLLDCLSRNARFSLIYSCTGLIHLLTSRFKGVEQSMQLTYWGLRLAPGGLMVFNDPNFLLMSDEDLQGELFPNGQFDVTREGLVFSVRRK